jgi:hypothetical protein
MILFFGTPAVSAVVDLVAHMNRHCHETESALVGLYREGVRDLENGALIPMNTAEVLWPCESD